MYPGYQTCDGNFSETGIEMHGCGYVDVGNWMNGVGLYMKCAGKKYRIFERGEASSTRAPFSQGDTALFWVQQDELLGLSFIAGLLGLHAHSGWGKVHKILRYLPKKCEIHQCKREWGKEMLKIFVSTVLVIIPKQTYFVSWKLSN